MKWPNQFFGSGYNSSIWCNLFHRLWWTVPVYHLMRPVVTRRCKRCGYFWRVNPIA